MRVTMTVNGAQVSGEVEPRLLLVHFVRDHLGLTGTHWGCDTSQCGTCVLLMDGQPVKSCTVLAVMADGHDIRTVEGMEADGTLDPVQQGFMHEHGLQCGFCTPGMIMASVKIAEGNPGITDEDVRHGLEGNFCRCTGYENIVKAVKLGAAAMGGGQS
jgi:carbon-monoxide dehydrogenase small subunit